MPRYIDYAKIPMQKNDIGAKTIGEYFEKLLLTLWDEQEDFSGKRPFGNGGWEYDVYASLISAGVVDGNLDEEGYVVDVTYSAANDIVCKMIKQIFARNIDAPAADVAPKSEVAREICCKIEEEIVAALESNYKAKAERLANPNPNIGLADEFISYCEGKIAALRGIEDFVEELKKKYTEEK